MSDLWSVASSGAASMELRMGETRNDEGSHEERMKLRRGERGGEGDGGGKVTERRGTRGGTHWGGGVTN